jgi:hypothetical protein
MITDELRNTITNVLGEVLSGIGFDEAGVFEDVDHDGDDILRIEIHYRKVGDSVDPTPTFLATTKLRRALAEIGEFRFPHLRHIFPEDQELKVA